MSGFFTEGHKNPSRYRLSLLFFVACIGIISGSLNGGISVERKWKRSDASEEDGLVGLRRLSAVWIRSGFGGRDRIVERIDSVGAGRSIEHRISDWNLRWLVVGI
jgi:hypothetical protein